MEVCCSFKAIVGGVCGADTRDKSSQVQVIPLLSCSANISNHRALFSFSGIENEVDLILCRAAVFRRPDDITSMTICPFHRGKLGVGWSRGGSTRCRVPPAISGHDKRKTWPKGDRGIGKYDSELLFHKTGVFIQAGSAICRKCRETMKELSRELSQDEEVDKLEAQLRDTTLDDTDEVSFNVPPVEQVTVPHTPGSIVTSAAFTPSAFSQVSDLTELEEESSEAKRSPREMLNEFLAARDVSPIRTTMTTTWDAAAERTKRHYLRKAKQVVSTVLQEISPQNCEELFSAVQTIKDSDNMDATLLEALVECYENSSHWSSRRQILSIIADKVSFSTLQKWIPDITRYRYNAARHHLLLHGRGAEVPIEKQTRIKVSPERLDHFLAFISSSRVVQDLPFGEKTLKLSSGNEIKIPNVIRTSIPELIVKQYLSHCKETGFSSPLSRSSLCRVLKVCSASMRTSLQGLDYFSADGAQAFDDITEVVDKLGDCYEGGLSWSKNMAGKLKQAKRYLKGDYKVHVSSSSKVPDHCRPFALSHPSDKDYMKSCDHEHDVVCERCNLFPAAVNEIESVLSKVDLPKEEKEEMKFIMAQSTKNVNAWKAHLLRSVNQDDARLDIQNSLDDESVLVVLDWAMKYVPKKYRESQADWFGKRGLSWHVSVAIRKLKGKPLEMLTLVHIFQKSNQDSSYILAVIDDVIFQLKRAMPNLKSVNFRQDNAGCFHSSATVLGVRHLSQKHDVNIRMDFSDPQGGKGACDRKAASVKNHMRSYLNSGHDIANAEQMKAAIDSNGGVRGVSTILCDSALHTLSSDPFPKWAGVSLINDIVYQKKQVKVWRAYGVGNGKCIPYSKLDANSSSPPPLPKLTKLKEADPTPTFCDVTPRQTVKQKRAKAATETETHPDKSHDTDSDTDEDTLFTCTVEGCVKTFQRFSSLQNHLDLGKHKYALERETFLDRAMLRYAENLESGESYICMGKSEDSESAANEMITPLQMGWALKDGAATRRRHTERQKKYMTEVFIMGEETGRKADPEEVSKAMRKARDDNGSFLFQSDEYLTSKQIASFFSRLSSKKTLPSSLLDDDQNDDIDEFDELSAIKEKEYEDMREKLLNEMSLQHPIVYERYNICEMASTSKLSKLSIATLQTICEHFELDISQAKLKRLKKPYVDMLTDLVKSCTCLDQH